MVIDDVPECVRIINAIIEVGGSTAYEEPYQESDFQSAYLDGTELSLAAHYEGRVVGFQGCFLDSPGVYSIGSFTDRLNPVKGAGSALTTATIAAARKKGATAIVAKITSDNHGGLAFYSKMGFEDFDVIENDHVRSNGTKVDRIIKRFDLSLPKVSIV